MSEFLETAKRVRDAMDIDQGGRAADDWLEANGIDRDDYMETMGEIANQALLMIVDEPNVTNILSVLRGSLSHACQIGFVVARNRSMGSDG